MKIPRRKHSEIKPKSVIEGGTEVGWTPISSVVLWKRMLGVMGNINDIKDPIIHGSVFKHLIEIWLMLENVSGLLVVIVFLKLILMAWKNIGNGLQNMGEIRIHPS